MLHTASSPARSAPARQSSTPRTGACSRSPRSRNRTPPGRSPRRYGACPRAMSPHSWGASRCAIARRSSTGCGSWPQLSTTTCSRPTCRSRPSTARCRLPGGAARGRIASIVAAPQRFAGTVLVDLAGRLLVAGERAHAHALMAELHSRSEPELDPRTRASARHIDAALARAAKPVPDGAVPFAILDYQSPDQESASRNLGDYIQTLALMGNLARFSGVRFSGEDGLGTLATELQELVRGDLRLSEQKGALHLLDVNREYSSGDAVPPDTWTIAFGWHMHPLYRLFCDFPYHPNLRPIFVAFHVNNAAMLDDAAVAYLRRYGPIGCRDWTTVHLLLSRGVDAFFTGCLTPTIDAIFPERDDVSDGSGPVGVIDLPRAAAGPGAADEAVVVSHAVDEYREMTLVDAMRTARALLTERQAEFSRVVTSRLHAYLPFVALGVPVDFRPHRPGDVRFPGLTGMTPGSPPLRRMQHTVRELLADVLGLVLEGASEDGVRTRWRELTAERVERARERFAAVAEPRQTSLDIAAAVAATRAAARLLPGGTAARQPLRRPMSCCGSTLSLRRRHRCSSRRSWRTQPARCGCGCSPARCPTGGSNGSRRRSPPPRSQCCRWTTSRRRPGSSRRPSTGCYCPSSSPDVAPRRLPRRGHPGARRRRGPRCPRPRRPRPRGPRLAPRGQPRMAPGRVPAAATARRRVAAHDARRTAVRRTGPGRRRPRARPRTAARRPVHPRLARRGRAVRARHRGGTARLRRRPTASLSSRGGTRGCSGRTSPTRRSCTGRVPRCPGTPF